MKKYNIILLISLAACLLFITPAILKGQDQNQGSEMNADIEMEKETLTNLLYEFLEGASYNDPVIHDRFWSEELIYTGSNGSRIGKEDIMSGLSGSGSPDRSEEPETRYDADEVQINVYDDMAVVAFRLIANINEPDVQETRYFYNTGTFRKHNGEWRAVAWQATVIP